MSLSATSPAWTLTGRPQTERSPQRPGPGSYTSSFATLERNPSYSISKAERSTFGKTDRSVGPGDYNQPSSPKGNSAVIGKTPRTTIKPLNSNPGPGNYESPSKLQEGPKYTIIGKAEKKLLETPGPGKYEIKTTVLEKSPSYRFGSDKRVVELDGDQMNPGPGAYGANRDLDKTGFKFGNEKRESMSREKIPGPGAYQIPTGRDRRAYSISGRIEPKSKESSPGPGAYENSSGIEKRCYTVSRSRRFGSMGKDLPGPGSYDVLKDEKSQGSVIGNELRKSFTQTSNEWPGPGQYESPNVFAKTSGFSISRRHENKNLKSQPGPGDYNAVPPLERIPNAVFGNEERKISPPDSIRNSFPGPADYNKTSDPDTPMWCFGTQQRINQNALKIPGPGAYDIPDFSPKVSYSLVPRRLNTKESEAPGPGHYENMPLKDKKFQYSIGKSERPWTVKDSSPGPGKYETNLKSPNHAPGTRSGPRPSIHKIVETPGAGAYEAVKQGNGPAYSIKQKYNIKFSSNPGPGQYNTLKEKSKSPVIGKSERFTLTHQEKLIRSIPAPGVYKSSETNESPRWAFGSSKKNYTKVAEVPGPGQYEIKSFISDSK